MIIRVWIEAHTDTAEIPDALLEGLTGPQRDEAIAKWVGENVSWCKRYGDVNIEEGGDE